MCPWIQVLVSQKTKQPSLEQPTQSLQTVYWCMSSETATPFIILQISKRDAPPSFVIIIDISLKMHHPQNCLCAFTHASENKNALLKILLMSSKLYTQFLYSSQYCSYPPGVETGSFTIISMFSVATMYKMLNEFYHAMFLQCLQSILTLKNWL